MTNRKMKSEFDYLVNVVKVMQEPKTINVLCEELNCTSRTVYRTMSGLNDLGFVIRKSKGVNPRKYFIAGVSENMVNQVSELNQLVS